MAENKSIIKALVTSSSLLLVIILALVFFYAQTLTKSSLFPQDVESWNKIFTVYLVVFSLILTAVLIYSRKTLKALVSANYWRSFLFSFIPNALIASLFLILIKFIIKSGNLNILSAISYVPIYILIFHLFVVSQVEEIMFKGLIYNSIRDKSGNKLAATVASLGLFALWHFAKTGGNVVAMITYIPLRYWWNQVSENGVPYLNKVSPKFFGATPNTCQAGAGQHFAWNVFILGFIAPFRI